MSVFLIETYVKFYARFQNTCTVSYSKSDKCNDYNCHTECNEDVPLA